MEVMVQEVRIENSHVRRALVEVQVWYASSGAWQLGADGSQNLDQDALDAWKPLVVVANLAQEQDMELM